MAIEAGQNAVCSDCLVQCRRKSGLHIVIPQRGNSIPEWRQGKVRFGNILGAEGGTRTRTDFRLLPPQDSVSTNSTTSAQSFLADYKESGGTVSSSAVPRISSMLSPRGMTSSLAAAARRRTLSGRYSLLLEERNASNRDSSMNKTARYVVALLRNVAVS